MKVSLLTHNWGHPWVKLFANVFEDYVVNDRPADVYLHAWSDGSTSPIQGAVNVFFLRRFELYSGWNKIDWANVDKLICVNDWIAERIKPHIPTDIEVVYNSVDLDRWTFKPRKHGKKIGMCGHVCMKKNYPLAMQILAKLPSEYELHIAGQIQDQCTVDYLDNIARSTKRKIYLYGYIPPEQMDIWWEDKNYCLCTAVSEGNPNNVNEAMAKGIKPIVHNWPGAIKQYGENVFDSVDEAVEMILHGGYSSELYRQTVAEKFGVGNLNKLADIVHKLYTEKKTMKENMELGINEQEAIKTDKKPFNPVGTDQKPEANKPVKITGNDGRNFTLK